MNGKLWRLTDVTVPGRRVPRLDRVTLDIPQGVTVIFGPSGAGKSTLLNLLVDFERPASGTVTRTLTMADDRLPVFWSPPGHGLWPHLTVASHLTSLLPGSPTELGRKTQDLLSAFDLEAVRSAYPGTLSLGERDRLSLARTLASRAHVVVLDEPLIHVQSDQARRYWKFVRGWCQAAETSIVMATHNLSEFLTTADYAVSLEAGRVMCAGNADELSRSITN